jgi:flagellar FliL protein
MAKKDSLNLSTNDAEEDVGSSSGGGKGKLFLIVGVVVLLLGGGAGAFMFMSGGDSAQGGSAEDVAEEAVEEAPPQVPLYLDVAKLLVNIEHEGRTRYVQAEMQLMSYDQAVIDQATRDMPAIRDRLLMLFSSQDFAALKTLEGKEALRADTLATVNTALGLSEPKVVNEVYFENFVLQ